MTREAFVNDDIGLITEMPGQYAAAAKRTINKQVYQILMTNPAIFDGVALFDRRPRQPDGDRRRSWHRHHAGHHAQAAEPDRPLWGEHHGPAPVRHRAVGYGFKMSQILESPQIDVEGIGSHTANALYQYRNTLQVVEEGTINVLAKGGALPWFMAGDPATGRSIQVDYLNGMKTPSIRRSQPAGRLGYVWDIWMDWGVSAVDWRGIAKNPGVSQ